MKTKIKEATSSIKIVAFSPSYDMSGVRTIYHDTSPDNHYSDAVAIVEGHPCSSRTECGRNGWCKKLRTYIRKNRVE